MPIHQRAGQDGGPDVGRKGNCHHRQANRQQHAIAAAGARQPDPTARSSGASNMASVSAIRCWQRPKTQSPAAKPIAGPEKEGSGTEQVGEHHQGVDETALVLAIRNNAPAMKQKPPTNQPMFCARNGAISFNQPDRACSAFSSGLARPVASRRRETAAWRGTTGSSVFCTKRRASNAQIAGGKWPLRRRG